MELLKGFRGDLHWIHEREGHVGRPYYPGGESGVTLDPGVDLGYFEKPILVGAYDKILSAEQMNYILSDVCGARGTVAVGLIGKADPRLVGIRISREQALAVFPHVAEPYWYKLVLVFKGLDKEDTPACVHTAVLSLGYNRGPANAGLRVLADPIKDKEWKAVGKAIGGMQQDHALKGIRDRRRLEGKLILDGLSA